MILDTARVRTGDILAKIGAATRGFIVPNTMIVVSMSISSMILAASAGFMFW